MKWGLNDIPDLKGKVAMVTGANSGLGYQSCLALAKRGAMVILAVRSREKGKVAAGLIKAEASGSDLIVMKVDLANIESIKHFADSFLEEFKRLDILINNAGVMAIPLRRTVQDFEMQFGVNHLGHFALTGLLIDVLNRTRDSRIVNVSSSIYRIGKINFDDLNWDKSYSKWKAYGQSKLANILFTIELDRRLKLAGKKTFVAAVHPGWAATNLQTRGPEMENAIMKKFLVNSGNKLFAQKASSGALTTLYAATSPDAVSSHFYGPGGLFTMHGNPTEEKIDSGKVNPSDAQKLWNASEQLTGIKFVIK